ncbi:MAG: hypothetical protein SGPRY_006916 [Prymnesium sp.]
MVAFSPAALKDLLQELYDEPATRAKFVADYATALGAQKVLSPQHVEELATLSTVDGFKVKKQEFMELAAPYIAKAYQADGRKELVAEASDLASEKVIKPATDYTVEKVAAIKVAAKEYATQKVDAAKDLASAKIFQPTKDFAEPYINKSTEIAAPYIAKLENKRAEILASKRYEKAVAAIKQVREHPSETASELKSKAIDLLKYEQLASYREYIQSEEFQMDTMRLVKVELPGIAADAASRGYGTIKQRATSLADDIEEKRGELVLALERGYSTVRKLELSDLKEKAKLLMAELHTQASTGFEEAKSSGFSFQVMHLPKCAYHEPLVLFDGSEYTQDAVFRMKKMVSAIDSILVTPIFSSGADPVLAAGPPEESEEPSGGDPAPASDDDSDKVDDVGPEDEDVFVEANEIVEPVSIPTPVVSDFTEKSDQESAEEYSP